MMKASLKQSFSLYSLADKAKLFTALMKLKAGIKISNAEITLIRGNEEFVQLIEKGVLFTSDGKYWKVQYTAQSPLTISLRKNTSDLKVFNTVIIQEEYKIAAEHLLKQNAPLVVVDAGGNIGLTSVYFNSFFPGTKFFIIEPDTANTMVLKQNLVQNKMNDKTVLYQNALWTSDENLNITTSFRDGENWSLAVEKEKENNLGGESLKGITLENIINTNQLSKIDLLKIDIEGAERFLYQDAVFIDTLRKYVTALVIEIHDEYNIREHIYQVMQDSGFKRVDGAYVSFFYKN